MKRVATSEIIKKKKLEIFTRQAEMGTSNIPKVG